MHQNKEPQTTWFQTTGSSNQFPQGWDLKSRCWWVVPSHRLTWGLLVQPGWLVVEFSFCHSELGCHVSGDQTVVNPSFSSYHTGSHIDPPAVPPGLTFLVVMPGPSEHSPASEWTHSRPWLHLQGLPMASLVFAQVTEKVVYTARWSYYGIWESGFLFPSSTKPLSGPHFWPSEVWKLSWLVFIVNVT